VKKQLFHIIYFRRILAVIVLFSSVLTLNAQDIASSGKPKVNKRLYGGFIFPIFTNNPYHTTGTSSSFSFNLGFKRTFIFASSKFDIGIEYLNQGLSFQSYYFAPGYSVLYDKSFPFLHDLRIQELQLPVLYRYMFGKETRNKTTPYLTIGWALRFIAYATSTIQSSDGILVFDDQTDLGFENPFITSRLSSMWQASFGLQFNNVKTLKAFYVELGYKLGTSRYHYVGNGTSNDLMIKDSNVTLNFGYKF